jgi:hypothetical protein
MKLIYLLVLLMGYLSSSGEGCYPIWIQYEHPLCYGHTRIMNICVDDTGNGEFVATCIGNPPPRTVIYQSYLPLIIGGE